MRLKIRRGRYDLEEVASYLPTCTLFGAERDRIGLHELVLCLPAEQRDFKGTHGHLHSNSLLFRFLRPLRVLSCAGDEGFHHLNHLFSLRQQLFDRLRHLLRYYITTFAAQLTKLASSMSFLVTRSSYSL